tara:strand:+ start:22984 stop:23619 length:636 start_codon:yes stop_codon:yes gene_type:complete
MFIKSLLLGGLFEIQNIKINHAKIGWNSVTFIVKGKDAYKLFLPEAGGHRVQRVPPTESKGRRHTSTITVSVLEKNIATTIEINNKDLRWDYINGVGKGGQNRNKRNKCVRLTHIPTGIIVMGQSEKSLKQNKQIAFNNLKSKLEDISSQKKHNKNSSKKREQIGSGMRGCKIRTYQLHNDVIINHKTGNKVYGKININKFMRGNLELIRK